MLGSGTMMSMLLMIVKLVSLLVRRVVNLMLLLSWRISIVVKLLMNLMFLATLCRSLSSSRRNLRNLTVHASLESSFLNFFAKCFFMLTSLSASVGYGVTCILEGLLRRKCLSFTELLFLALCFGILCYLV